jgi:hypothetical protein
VIFSAGMVLAFLESARAGTGLLPGSVEGAK